MLDILKIYGLEEKYEECVAWSMSGYSIQDWTAVLPFEVFRRLYFNMFVLDQGGGPDAYMAHRSLLWLVRAYESKVREEDMKITMEIEHDREFQQSLATIDDRVADEKSAERRRDEMNVFGRWYAQVLVSFFFEITRSW